MNNSFTNTHEGGTIASETGIGPQAINMNRTPQSQQSQQLGRNNAGDQVIMGSTVSSQSNQSSTTNPLSLVSASVPTSVSEMLR